MLMTAGTFTGNGTSQAIAHGLGVSPSLVVVKRTTATLGRWKIPNLASTTSKRFNHATGSTDAITGMDSTEFTLGSSTDVNASGGSYGWFAIGDSGDSDFAIDTWTGDGSGAKTITVSEFTDIACVWVLTSNLAIEQWRVAGGAVSHSFINSIPGGITAIGSGTFDVATALNASGTTFYSIAFKTVADKCGIELYTGNASDNRQVALSGVSAGVIPTIAMIGNATTSTRYRQFRCTDMHTGDASQPLGEAVVTDRIQAFGESYVEVGANADVNATSADMELFWLATDPLLEPRRRVMLRL